MFCFLRFFVSKPIIKLSRSFRRTAYQLINALIASIPPIFVLQPSSRHAVAKRSPINLVVLLELIGRHHLERSHQFVVLMLQKMAMVDITRILNKLIFRRVEVGIASFPIHQVISGGPSHSKDQNCMILEQSHFLPTSVLWGDVFIGNRPANILIFITTTGQGIVSDSLRFICNFFIHIKPNH